MKSEGDSSTSVDSAHTGEQEHEHDGTPMQTTTATSSRPSQTPAGDTRAIRILAKSVYRELRSSGHSQSDIVAFTNSLLELVTTDLRDENATS